MKKLVTVFIIFCIFNVYSFEENIKKIQWGDIEVVWLEDNRFPTFSFSVYFADGSLHDKKKGEVSMMFNQLHSGTRRYSQKDIAENLEFFGTTYGGHTNHEYSVYKVSGLTKDIVPTMKQICHIFNDASFPKLELAKSKKRAISDLKSLVGKHSGLINRVFREVSLSGSPFSYPVSGKIKDINSISQKDLVRTLKYFNKNVKKRIYITGSKDVLKTKSTILNDCNWKGDAKFTRVPKYSYSKIKNKKIYLVDVPNANQAQLMIGRFLTKAEFNEPEVLALTGRYFGGGFTSVLMHELRTLRGLTYGARSVAVKQANYGRSIISSSTKNDSLVSMIKVIKDNIEKISKGNINEKNLELAKGYIAGSHSFKFESNDSFLNQLLFIDHVGRKYSSIYTFPTKVSAILTKEISITISKLFNWDDQIIVVLGDKSLLKKLKKIAPVKMLRYKYFL